MIGFDISILIISSQIPEYTEEDLWVYMFYDKKCRVNVFQLNSVSDYKHFLNFLNEHKTIDYIVTNQYTDEISLDVLKNSSVEFTRKWYHYDNFPSIDICINGAINTIKYNLNRKLNTVLFSIYTPTYNTSKEMLDTLYNSLCSQTYQHWNWYVLDDSLNDETCNILKDYNDARINIIKNVSNHGNIGYNKHNIAMMCNGDWLLEVDHDDELTCDCLATLNDAINEFPNSKFIYSDAVEESMKYGKMYGDEFTFCHWLGKYKTETINGQQYNAAYVGALNPIAIRSILAAPNHIRCFKKDFYHNLNGHSCDMSILDDMELMSRAFLNIENIDEITYIPKILYLQHNENTTARSHVNITVTYNFVLVVEKYDKLIHEKLLSLGITDPTWDDENQCTRFDKETVDKYRDVLPTLCNVYDI